MLIKPLILDSHYRMLKIQGNLFYGNGQTVCVGSRELPELVSIAVVQKSSVSQRGDINLIHIRSVIYDTSERPDPYAAHNDAERDQGDEQNSDKRNMSPFSHHGCTGNQRISFLCN